MPETLPAAKRLQTTAKVGAWLTTLVLVLLSCLIAFFLWTALSDSNHAAYLLTDQLDLTDDAPQISTLQALLVTALWLVTDAVAFAMLWQTRALFLGIRAKGVFTLPTARRIRNIGWLVFIIGPLSVVINAACILLLGLWQDPSGVNIEIGLDDADLYAAVLGLVIVALGHMMVEATAIDAENRAFV